MFLHYLILQYVCTCVGLELGSHLAAQVSLKLTIWLRLRLYWYSEKFYFHNLLQGLLHFFFFVLCLFFSFKSKHITIFCLFVGCLLVISGYHWASVCPLDGSPSAFKHFLVFSRQGISDSPRTSYLVHV